MKNFLSKLFDSRAKELARLREEVKKIDAFEEKMRRMDSADFPRQTEEFRARLQKGENLDDILPEAFALVREAADRTIGQRHYPEQMIGGIVLHRGQIAEMKTGEGKTLTSTLAIYLNALLGKGVHVVTVNDYLARRDANWMGVIFDALGLTTACIVHGASYQYRPQVLDDNEVDIEYENLVPISRAEAYAADITYGTNNEFGFDYLRDNMAQSPEQIVQRPPHFAIVDEVDSILIDEARTPLIISAPDTESTKLYEKFARLVPVLKPEKHYVVDEKLKAVTLTDAGVDLVESKLGVDNLYEPRNIHLVHHLEQAIKAQVIFQRDRDYVVKDGQVVIVDDFTGRLMEGRRYSEGLHQAIEAKEGVTVQKESKTLATVTFQNYFRLYEKLAGMTGTAMTNAEEFSKVYNLEVVEIPTHRPLIREDRPDIVYKTEEAKFRAIADAVEEAHRRGQPVLVGTIAIEKSELMSKLLKKRGIPHEVLNAKNHEREAQIIAKAGMRGAVTIATNMAGRGTDIKLGEGVAELGGLFIIGSERHEARRIDNQLRGRAGRQGDPGVSQFFVSLEDELMRRFGGDKLKSMMTTLGLPDDEPIHNKMIARAIENAQTKIEGFNFDLRKHVLEYDDVVNKQRETVYARRRKILFAEDPGGEIPVIVADYVSAMIGAHTAGEELHWELEKIAEECGALIPGVDKERIIKELEKYVDDENLEREEKIEKITAYLAALVGEYIDRREDEFGRENWNNIVRAVILQAIDRHWMQHLDALDYLRQGIGLRGYGQRDPLIEYKREAFAFFRETIAAINETVVQTLLRLSSGGGEESAPTTPAVSPENWQLSGGEEVRSFASLRAEAGQSAGAEEKTKQQPIVNTSTVGRNDPCPCGSGKKYKKCCGR